MKSGGLTSSSCFSWPTLLGFGMESGCAAVVHVLRHVLRYGMPVIFSVLCSWQGNGSPMLTLSLKGKCEGRACWRCDMSWCSHQKESGPQPGIIPRCHQLQTRALGCNKESFLLLLWFVELVSIFFFILLLLFIWLSSQF